MKKWKLYTILFLSLFSSISFMFTLKSYAVKVNDGNYYFTDRIKNNIIDHFYGTNFNYSFYPRRQNNDSIDVKYFLHKRDDENHFEGYAYICTYKNGDGSGSVLVFPSCGIGLNKNAGRYNVMFRSPHVVSFWFNKEDKDVYNLNNVGGGREGILRSFSDSDFDNGLKVYGDVLFNDWKKPVNNLKELDEPKPDNNSSSDKKNDFSFFTPMIKSIENLLNFVKDLYNSIKDFFLHFFEKLGELFKSLFVPSSEYMNNYTSRIKAEFSKPFDKFDTVREIQNSVLMRQQINFNCGGTNYFPNYNAGSGSINMGLSSSTSIYSLKNIHVDFCSVPKPLIYIARALLSLAMLFVLVDTFMHTITVVMGDRKIWESKEDKE